jgi:hypothetical protein
MRNARMLWVRGPACRAAVLLVLVLVLLALVVVVVLLLLPAVLH